nr:hypothetical protein [Candidatus Njordarchaeum guaymaensis]
MSLEPMKFGTEKEFEIALTELRWIEKVRGNLSESDFQIVAQKYSFPADFLREGLKGLQFPRDYIISQSRWFPILYVWNKHFRALHHEYFKLTVDYVWSGALFLFVALTIPMLGIFFAQILLAFGFVLQNVLLGVTPLTVTLTVSFSLWFASKWLDTKSKWEQFTVKFESEVPRKDVFLTTVNMTNRLINKNPIMARILAKKDPEDFVPMNFFQVGDIEVPEQKKKSRLRKICALLSVLLPLLKERDGEPQFETVPVYFGENPDLEYSKRVKKLLGSKETQL